MLNDLKNALLGFVIVGLCLAHADETTLNLDAVLQKILPANGESAVVLVERDGKQIFAQAYGLADRENKIATTLDTKFEIGPLTQQFTAAAILHLAEEGKLSLEDPLSKYFPALLQGNKITVRHLLTHTSGLIDYITTNDFKSRGGLPISEDDLQTLIERYSPAFPAGDQYSWNHSNYALLTFIIEKTSGLSYEHYLKKQFFDPLGMKHTGLYQNAAPPEQMAKDYGWNMQSAALNRDKTWALGMDGLYSTAGDLALWTQALENGQVISPASLEIMKARPVMTKKKMLYVNGGMGLGSVHFGWLPATGCRGPVDGYTGGSNGSLT